MGAFHGIATAETMAQHVEIRDAFALYDMRGTGAIPRESLGDLLRALGQNPTQAEVADLASQQPSDIDLHTFTQILNRPDGYKAAGHEEEFVRAFAVFDKDATGHIGVGELRYILTNLGEKLSDEEVDELLAMARVNPQGTIDYRLFVKELLKTFA